MNQKWIIIAEYLNEAEVSAFLSLLSEAGIQSWVERSITSDTLSIMRAGLTGTKLLVNSSDCEKATQLLNEERLDLLNKKLSGHPSWFCPTCGEEVDGGFQKCWKCQTEIDSSIDLSDSINPESEEVTHKEQELQCPACGETQKTDENVCKKCGANNSETVDDLAQSSHSSIQEAELLLRSAWRASVMGTLVLPCILNFRSMFLLLKFHQLDVPDHLKSNWRKSAALYVNLILLAYWGLVLFCVGIWELLLLYFVTFLQTFFYWDPFHTWEIRIYH